VTPGLIYMRECAPLGEFGHKAHNVSVKLEHDVSLGHETTPVSAMIVPTAISLPDSVVLVTSLATNLG
jgi:hypothetical protein